MSAMDRACAALTARPVDADRFLEAVQPLVSRIARTFYDPDEVAQRALIKLRSSLSGCRARTPRRLRAWIRTIVRRCGCTLLARRTYEPLDDLGLEDSGPTPDPWLGEALQRCLDGAVDLDVATLPPAERALAARLRISRRREQRAQCLACLVRVRIDREPTAAVGDDLGLGQAAVKASAMRGAALLALTARVLAAKEQDLFLRDALHRMAVQGGVGSGA